MNFQKLQKVENGQFYVRKALNNCTKGKKVKGRDEAKRKINQEIQKADLFRKSIYEDLKRLEKSFPSMEELNPFYIELMDILIGVDILKRNLGSVNGSKNRIINIWHDYRNRLRRSQSLSKAKQLKRELIGRVASIMKKLDKSLKFLEKSRQKMRRLPNIKTKIETISIFGFPNVGKSTLLNKITGSNAEIKNYPFTTKRIMMGYLNKEIQFLDTPGTLNRFEKMNTIEKQAYLALKHLSKKVIFVFDITESCGYSIKLQEELLKNLKKTFEKKEIVIYLSKVDLLETKKIKEFKKLHKKYKIFIDSDQLTSFLVSKL